MTRFRQLTHDLPADLVGLPMEVRAWAKTTRSGTVLCMDRLPEPAVEILGIDRLRYPGGQEADCLGTRGLQ